MGSNTNGMSVDTVVVCFNSDRALLVQCIESLIISYKSSNVDGSIIVVDNASESSPDFLEEDYGCRVIKLPENVGFGAASNVGVATSKADICLLLNPDAMVDPDCFHFVSKAVTENPDAVLCGWLSKNGIVQVDAFLDWRFSTSRLLRRGRARSRLMRDAQNAYVEVPKVCGGALFARRLVLESLGPFDERFFLYGEDSDLSTRAREEGRKLLGVPSVRVEHEAAASQKKFGQLVERARADAAIRLCAYHEGRVMSLLQRFELFVVTLIGLVVGGKSSASARARIGRFSEIKRWGFAQDRPRFNP